MLTPLRACSGWGSARSFEWGLALRLDCDDSRQSALAVTPLYISRRQKSAIPKRVSSERVLYRLAGHMT